MKTSVVGRKLSSNLIDSCLSSADIDGWIARASKQIGGVVWRHVGWTSEDPDINNAGICDIASDKRAPIAEVIVNCIDSLIDLAHIINGLEAPSPHAAVATWPQFAEGPDSWVNDRILFEVHGGPSKKHPTLDIRDFGRGQRPEDFRHTFLSLHSSTKLSSPHLCGKFGMGMKSSFKFCERVLIVSRPHAAAAGRGSVETGLAVVRKSYTAGDKAAHYEYLCDHRGGIIRLDLSEDSFRHGTLVRLAGYDLAGYEGNIGRQNKSLRLLLNSFMIDPPVFIKASDCRGSGARKNMTVYGLLHSLRNPRTPNSHKESFSIKVPFCGEESEVVVHYFVLHPQESPHDASGTKVKAEQAITFSHNGQRHGAEPRLALKTKFGLGMIRNRLAVVVDTSRLHPVACGDLYSSDRVKINSQSDVYTSIMDAMKAHFDADEDLQALDEEATKQSRVDNSVNTETVEKAMSDYLVGLLGKKRAFRKVGVAKGGGGKSRRNRNDAGLPDLPTRILIDNSPFVAPKGRFAYLTLDIDAKNGYVEPGDGKVSVSFKSKVASVRTVGSLVGGKLRLVVDVSEDAEKGDSQFDVKLDDAANKIHLSASGTVRIVEPKVGKSGSGNKKTTGEGDAMAGPNVIVSWATGDDRPQDWSESTPGDCVVKVLNGETTVIFTLNGDFPYIKNLRESLPKIKGGSFDSRLKEYADMMCRALANQEINHMTPEASFATAVAESVFASVYRDTDDGDEEPASKTKGRRPIPGIGRVGGISKNPTFLAESAAAARAGA